MHLLLIHQAFASLDQAGGTRHYEMARFLVSRGHQVTIIASPVSYLTGKSQNDKVRWLEREQPEDGITILRVFTYPALHKSFFHRLISFFSFMVSSFLIGLSINEIDLIWGTSPPIFQGLTAWLIARIKGVRFLFEVRDLWPAFAVATGVLRNRLLIRLSEGLECFLYRHADRVMVNSPGFIEHVSSHGARWVELVPNGADPSMFDLHQNGLPIRQQWGLNDEFVVLYAGAHGLSNDLEVALDSAWILRDEGQIRFVLVGDGKEKTHLIRRAQELGLTNVLFVPPVAKKEMGEILSAADACLAILKPLEWYRTTYPNKVFDYMAAGKPVVLAIEGVIREVIETHNAGVAVPPGDPQALAQVIRNLAADPQKAREMGLAGRKAVESCYNRQRFSIRLAEIIEEMRF